MAALYSMYQNIHLFLGLVVVIAIWDLVWKGIALWFAGKNQQKTWFVCLLIFNTAGILPIIYLLCCRDPRKMTQKKKEQPESEKKEVVPVVAKEETTKKTTPKKSTTKKKSTKK